jgi:hypothetical protein
MQKAHPALAVTSISWVFVAYDAHSLVLSKLSLSSRRSSMNRYQPRLGLTPCSKSSHYGFTDYWTENRMMATVSAYYLNSMQQGNNGICEFHGHVAL